MWVNTFSGFCSASIKKGEGDTETIQSLAEAISRMGKPQQINKDQGRGYISHKFKNFCRLFLITHHLHTPYSPTSSGLVERTNGFIRGFLARYHLDNHHLSIELALQRALWTLNFIQVSSHTGKTRAALHRGAVFPAHPEAQVLPPQAKEFKPLYYKIPGVKTQKWLGPLVPLQTSAGAALIPDPAHGPVWVPWRLLKKAPHAKDQKGV